MTVLDAPGLDIQGSLLSGSGRVAGEFFRVRDDSGQNAKHSGAIKPNVFCLGIGLGSEIHNDLFAALQTLQPIAAPA
jgi:hypothetical protein